MQLQMKISNRLRMRLIRYLASAGVASRRKCESIITGGRVTVNGKDETDLLESSYRRIVLNWIKLLSERPLKKRLLCCINLPP